MATQAVKQYREPIAFGLLGIAVVYLACGLALLFKSYDNHSYSFAVRAALDGHVFSSPVIVVGLALAVLLVAVWDEPTPHARTTVLAATAIGAVAIVFAVISWIAALSADEIVPFAGVGGAGKIAGAFLGLAQIALLGLALFFAGTVLQSLPRPVRAAAQQQWGPPYQQPGWAPNQEWQQGGQWGAQQYQPPPWTTPPGQQPWDPGQGQPQPPGWGQPSATQAQHGWQQPTSEWQQPPATAYEATPQGQEPGWPQSTGSEGSTWPAQPEQSSWRVFDDEAPASAAESGEAEPAQPAWQPTSPAHAGEPDETETEQPAAAGPDDETTTMRSWSSGSTASASEVAADDVDAEDEGEDPSDEGRSDDSGWWRPSAT